MGAFARDADDHVHGLGRQWLISTRREIQVRPFMQVSQASFVNDRYRTYLMLNLGLWRDVSHESHSFIAAHRAHIALLLDDCPDWQTALSSWSALSNTAWALNAIMWFVGPATVRLHRQASGAWSFGIHGPMLPVALALRRVAAALGHRSQGNTFTRPLHVSWC